MAHANMSVYRQQAILSSLNDASDRKSVDKTESFLQKTSAVASYPSSSGYASSFDPNYAQNSTSSADTILEVSEKQSKFIADTMHELRQKELDDRATKKLKTNHKCPVDSCSDVTENCQENSSGIDIVDAMETHPNIAQMVATSGGLITVWNDSFLEVVKPTTSMSQIPLTIFDLVEPRSLHKLYGMLALALDEDVFIQQEASADSGEDDFNSRSHMSIILPTKKFRHTSINYEMTIVFMEHIVPRERSFLGWITPAPSFPNSASISGCVSVSSEDDLLPDCDQSRRNLLPRGTILRLLDSVLCQLLRGKEH